MGCNCSTEASVSKVRSQIKFKKRDESKRSHFLIKIFVPNSQKSKEIIIEDIKENLLVSELMNMACFNSKYMEELDANFISVYNKTKDEFDYFIQRLCGYEMSDSQEWTPYVNNIRENWTEICVNNRIIFKYDDFEFRFEAKKRRED
jgi:hypothetical protein